MGTTKLTAEEIAAAGLDGWVLVAGELRTSIRTADFAGALALVNTIGAAAEEMNHHPDLELGWGRVGVRLSSHDVGGITARDLQLARRISAFAAAAGSRADADANGPV